MHIKVKGVSGHLVFVFDDSQEFNSLMSELESLLESPLLKSDGYFPRAFFDFKSRILSVHELSKLLELLFEKQVLLFDGINMVKKEQKNDGIHVYAGIDDQIMKNAVNIFKNTYPDIQVTLTEQEISDNSEELYEYGER